MGIETAEDRAVFFDVAEHAVEATYDGGTIKGIFQAAFLPIDVGGYQQIEGTAPRFTCAEADVPAADHGKTLTIDGVTYRITGTEPDGTGLVTLILQKG